MPRGSKLDFGSHSAGSCVGKSDDTGSSLGNFQFCKSAAQVQLQTPLIWGDIVGWRNVKADLVYELQQMTILPRSKLRRVSKDLCKLLAAYLLHCIGLAKGKPFPVRLGEPTSKCWTLHLVKVTHVSRSSACMPSEQARRDMLLFTLMWQRSAISSAKTKVWN